MCGRWKVCILFKKRSARTGSRLTRKAFDSKSKLQDSSGQKSAYAATYNLLLLFAMSVVRNGNMPSKKRRVSQICNKRIELPDYRSSTRSLLRRRLRATPIQKMPSIHRNGSNGTLVESDLSQPKMISHPRSED